MIDPFESVMPQRLMSQNPDAKSAGRKRKRARIRAAAALVISTLLGTAAVADAPLKSLEQRKSLKNDAELETRLELGHVDGLIDGQDDSLRTILASFLQEAGSPEGLRSPPSDMGKIAEMDDIDMSDLEALEKRLKLDSLDDLETDLDEMEDRLNLDRSDKDSLRKSEDKNRKMDRKSDDDDGDQDDSMEQALPEVVNGRFVMPPLDLASTDTQSIGNGRRPDEFRTAAERPLMPLPESALDRTILWTPMLRTWAASGNFSHPLYFEDRMLERHGHARWGYAQPLVSGARFFSGVALLPYLSSIQHPCQCRYSMGYYRAGSCTPAFVQRPPWDREAVVAQSIASAGGLWIMP